MSAATHSLNKIASYDLPRAALRPVIIWLMSVAALVFAMVVIGGITRLSRSGLSIVEWKPILGAIPPLTEQSWLQEFAKYQRTPEYLHVNRGMSLTEFKEIFYVEWAHRLLGRLIGLAVFIPLIYFAVRKQLSRVLQTKLLIILLLGGLQGALGWFMVKSGLVDTPRVSPYRLTAHLSVAIFIYAYIVWIVLDLIYPVRSGVTTQFLQRFSFGITSLVGLMIVAGGFVAGTKAGFAFNTFPLMNGAFAPPGMYALQPWWTNLFENVATVQFNHRMIGYVLVAATTAFYFSAIRTALSANIKRVLHLLLAALVIQASLGIAALLLVVPIWLGALHQAGALIVLTLALYINHALKRTPT
jgi:heme a synthase